MPYLHYQHLSPLSSHHVIGTRKCLRLFSTMIPGRLNVVKDVKRTNRIVRFRRRCHLVGSEEIPCRHLIGQTQQYIYASVFFLLKISRLSFLGTDSPFLTEELLMEPVCNHLSISISSLFRSPNQVHKMDACFEGSMYSG
jgi:hypothetical protein